jgi:hypothetical protein
MEALNARTLGSLVEINVSRTNSHLLTNRPSLGELSATSPAIPRLRARASVCERFFAVRKRQKEAGSVVMVTLHGASSATH